MQSDKPGQTARYAVKQTTYIWARSRNEAARLVRRNQLNPDQPHGYSDFLVLDMIETPDAFIEDDTTRSAICILDSSL